MDEAFLPLSTLIPGLLPRMPDLHDVEHGVTSYITGYDVTTPVELDVVVDAAGVHVGSTPPIYHLETSQLPVFHSLRLVAVLTEEVGHA
jgi:uncharacterized protein YwlG (UPF0340 family)